MDYTINYYSDAVQEQIIDLPDTLAARYIVLTRRMIALGPNMGEPHTKPLAMDCLSYGSKALKV